MWRGNSGSIVYGFLANFGGCSVPIVELKAIFIELKLVWERGFRHIRVDLDSTLVVKLLSQGVAPCMCESFAKYALRENVSLHVFRFLQDLLFLS